MTLRIKRFRHDKDMAHSTDGGLPVVTHSTGVAVAIKHCSVQLAPIMMLLVMAQFQCVPSSVIITHEK